MEALSGLIGMMLGVVILVLVLVVAIYIVQGIFLTKLNKLMYGKGSALAWIPIANVYLLGKLTINKIVGWILVIVTFCTMTFTTTLNGVEKTTSILPESISSTVSNILSVVEFGLLIYAIIKYFKLKKELAKSNSQVVQQDTIVSPIEQNNMNVGVDSNVLNNQVQPLNQANIESMPLEQNVINQTTSENSVIGGPVQMFQQDVVTEPVETVTVQEIPVVSEPEVPIVQQPVQAEPISTVQQPVVETMAVQEVPVVSEPTAFNQQPVQEEPISAVQQPAVETMAVQEVPVVSEPTAFNQQPVQEEPISVVQQPVVETIDIPKVSVTNDSTIQSNNN